MVRHDVCDDLLFSNGEDTEAGSFTPTTSEILVREQFGDLFCTKTRAQIIGGADIPFQLKSQGYLVRKVSSIPQIVVPHSLQS